MPEELNKPKNFFTPFTVLNIVIFLGVIVSNFYFFYYKKSYNFIVEVSCDPQKEICFERDCSNPDDCPSNGLSNFKRYSLKASDFKYCHNEDCADACGNNQIKCSPVECKADTEVGESCTSSEIIMNNIEILNQ